MPLFLLRFWKPALGAVLLAAILWQIHSYGNRREAAGRAAVEAQWATANKVAAKVAQDAETARIASESATAARNQEIARENAEKSARLAADNGRLERLLRNALARRPAIGGGSNPEVAGIPGTAPASATGGDGPPAVETGGIAADIASALTEARQNADALDALIAEIRPQL